MSFDDHNEDMKSVLEIFEDPFYAEIFSARCHDTGEGANIENARLFKEAIVKRTTKDPTYLKLNTLRLGVNSITALAKAIQDMNRLVKFLNVYKILEEELKLVTLFKSILFKLCKYHQFHVEK